MSTKKEIWRLLEPGVDVWQEGDEMENHVVRWEAVPSTWAGHLVRRDAPHSRRRMTLPEPQGWISVKERMPTKEDGHVLLWNGNVCYLSSSDSVLIASPTHWMSLPNPPAPIDPDEEAWEKAWPNLQRTSYSEEAAKAAFMAGRKSVMTEKEGEA